MRISVGKKLGLGFGVVIALLGISTVVVYNRTRQLNDSVRVAVDQALPSARICQAMIGDLYETLAAMRGYIILGNDPKSAQLYTSLRAEAWQELDQHQNELNELSNSWKDESNRQTLLAVKPIIAELRQHQQRIEDTMYTDANIPAIQMMQNEVLPLLSQMSGALAAISQEEIGLDATAERKAMQHELDTLRLELSNTASDLQAHLHYGNQKTESRLNQQWNDFQAAHAKLASQTGWFTEAQLDTWRRYAQAFAQFETYPARLVSMRNADDWNLGYDLLENEVAPRVRHLNGMLTQLADGLNESAVEHRALIAANSRAVTMTLMGGSLLAALFATIIAVFLSRRIVSSIQAVATGAGLVADGDLRGDDINVASRDELGELAVAFNKMRAGLRDITSQLRQATENVNSTAAEILASTQQQATATKEQASTVQEITTTLEEINQSGGQIGERAKKVSASVEEASLGTERGIKATQDTSQTMASVRDQVEEVAENVVSLSERTQTIGEIIATVSEIAEQSNLLALNASIEAVSAGEKGGRFSVVAHEMKNLADRAKDCTVQVRTILGEIQKGINTSVMLTEEAVKRVDSGKQQAHATESTIREVTDSSRGSIEAFQQIVAGANQQQIGVAQVTQGMQEIRQAIKQTAVSTEQLEKAAANMNALSNQLQNAVTRYRV